MVTYTEQNEIWKQRFRIGTAAAVPTTLYLALSKTPISPDGSGITEPSGGAYTRIGIASDSTNWSTPTNGSFKNLVRFDFPTATADWGTITYVALFDAATGGTMRYYQP